MTQNHCKTCKFRHHLTNSIHDECRYNPPTLVIVGENDYGDKIYKGVWPPVFPDSWCGKHIKCDEKDET